MRSQVRILSGALPAVLPGRAAALLTKWSIAGTNRCVIEQLVSFMRRRARGSRWPLAVCCALAVFALGGNAEAITLRAGDIVIIGDGGFSPTKLPRHENAPITIHGGGRITTVSGVLPPILETIDIE